MSDPVRVSVGVRAVSSNTPAPQKFQKKIEQDLSNPIRVAQYAAGMGIKSLTLNKESDIIEFELEEEFYHTLRTISKWKHMEPEDYLSQLLTEYILSIRESNAN